MPPRCAPAPCTSRPGGRRGCGDLWKRGERRGHSPGRPSSLCRLPPQNRPPETPRARGQALGSGTRPAGAGGPWSFWLPGAATHPSSHCLRPREGTPGSHPSKVPLSSRTLAFCLAEVCEGRACHLCAHCSSSGSLVTIASIR